MGTAALQAYALEQKFKGLVVGFSMNLVNGNLLVNPVDHLGIHSWWRCRLISLHGFRGSYLSCLLLSKSGSLYE